MSKVSFQFRPSQERGGADHGWLKTFHTFSFASYYDPKYESFGSLRVINEDRVAPRTGFPTHRHAEAEIFSYILSGELSHKDSMGNVETMKRGDVQMTSGGTGISHSEYNDHKSEECHFLQIWAMPNQRGLTPKYYARHYTDEQKKDKIVEIVAPVGFEGVQDTREGDGPTPVHANLHFLTTLLSPSTPLTHTLRPRTKTSLNTTDPGKLFYAQLVQSSGYNKGAAIGQAKVKVSLGDKEATLGEGDGVFVRGVKEGDVFTVENTGKGVGELVMFEIDA